MPTVRRAPLEMQLDALDYANAMPLVWHQDEVPLVVVGHPELRWWVADIPSRRRNWSAAPAPGNMRSWAALSRLAASSLD
jgi:hypothetical protein